nr:unnamed protein product [Callosobruchus chinensis]
MRSQESDPESTASEEVKKEKSRKRTREPELWKRNKIKRSRNSGKSYVNWKGNLVVERKLKAPCACRLKCSNKITGENRSNVITGYWGLSDINRQRDYISKYVICQKKARSRKRNITENQEDIENEECNRRNVSFVYHLPLEEQPKKDLCDICHRYENGSTDEKISLGDEYQLHLKNKNLARALKAADKERAKQKTTLCCGVFDLQQVLSVPKSEVGLAYYKLKLSTYNFTVFDLAYKDACCYMWYQCIGNRGASEIGSCLLLFIETHIRKGVNEFAFYSENCAGQNRNKYLSSLYNYLSQSIKLRFVTLSWKKDILSRKATQYTALSKRPLGMYRCTDPSSGILLSGPVNGNNLT